MDKLVLNTMTHVLIRRAEGQRDTRTPPEKEDIEIRGKDGREETIT